MSNPKPLYKLLKDVPCSELLQHPSDTYYLPSECVGIGPRIVSSMLARAFGTELWLVGGKQLTYEELADQTGFRGVGSLNEIYLWEVWQDNGDDGHVSYRHMGWAYIDRETINEKFREMSEFSINRFGKSRCIEDIIREHEEEQS